MSQAEELLNSLSESVAEHTHPVTDADTYFIIDPVTREIENTNRKKTVVMQYDHNSERFTFQLPRYIDGHDMLQCNSVVVNVDNVEEETGATNSDAPAMTDLHINPDDDETIISSWLISRNSTQLAGNLSFSIEYKCVADDGEVLYEFGTDSYDDIEVRARKKNGEASVIEYTDTLEQWRTQIFGAGDSVMSNITAEGEAQVTAVKAESNTQQAAVELKGAQTLESIPEDYTETNNMAEEAVRSKSNAIICESTNESIVLNDSSNDHIRGLKLFGKTTQIKTTGAQLANLPDAEVELGGITWSCKNGVVTAVGTCNAESSSTGTVIMHNLTGLTGTFHVSGNSNPAKVYVRTKKNGTEKWYNDTTFTLDGTEEDVLFYIQVADVGTVVNTTLYPMLNAGDTALPWEPYTGGVASPNPEYPQELVSVENPTVNVYGKNLLTITATTQESNGITFTVKDDKTVVINGTASADAYCGLTQPTILSPGKYILSGCTTGGSSTYFLYADTGAIYNRDSDTEFTVDTRSERKFLIKVHSGTTVNNAVIKPMLRLVEVENNVYETPTEVQTTAINRSIHGIPVTSGGNYTDKNGQQWICDEVDFERGVYVKKLAHYVFDGSDDEAWRYLDAYNGAYLITGERGTSQYDTPLLCNHALCRPWGSASQETHFCFVNGYDDIAVGGKELIDAYPDLTSWRARLAMVPLEVVYPLETPIETPLTAEEITAFKALRTNCPNTTILNDAGAWMSVKYNADTKTYIENPKTLKLVDSSTGVVYELKIIDGALTVVQV